MMLKKLTIAGFAVMGLSGMVQADAIDVDGTSNTSVTEEYVTEDGMFVVSEFEYTVSANVALASDEDSVAFAVASASQKGRNAYTASSNGGSVSTCGEPAEGTDVPTVPTPSLTADGGCDESSGS